MREGAGRRNGGRGCGCREEQGERGCGEEKGGTAQMAFSKVKVINTIQVIAFSLGIV